MKKYKKDIRAGDILMVTQDDVILGAVFACGDILIVGESNQYGNLFLYNDYSCPWYFFKRFLKKIPAVKIGRI
jgi:hypothetical protein